MTVVQKQRKRGAENKHRSCVSRADGFSSPKVVVSMRMRSSTALQVPLVLPNMEWLESHEMQCRHRDSCKDTLVMCDNQGYYRIITASGLAWNHTAGAGLESSIATKE